MASGPGSSRGACVVSLRSASEMRAGLMTFGARSGSGHVGLAYHGSRPSVRTVGRRDTLAVQHLGDLGEGLAFREQRPDLRPPSIVTVVAPDVGESNVPWDEMPAVLLEDRVVVGRGRPLGARRRDTIE